MSLDVGPAAAGSSGCDLFDLEAFAALSGGERDEAFMDTERAIRQMQVVQALRLHRVGVSGSHFDDGHRTAKIWHRRVTNGSAATSAQQAELADMLAALPEVAAAGLAGDLGIDQLRRLAALHANPRARDQLPGYWEAELANYGRRWAFTDFVKICRQWERNADPDGAKQRHEIARGNRSAQRSVVGEGSKITVKGDALSGEITWQVIEAYAEAEYLSDVERRAAQFGDDAENHPLARTHAQRMHDAFVAVCITARDAARGATDDITETTADATTDTTDTMDTTHDTASDSTAAAEARADAPSSTCSAGAGMTDPLVVIHSTPEFAIAALLEYFGFDPARYLDIADRMTKSQRLRFCETAGGAQIDPRTLAVALLCGQVQRIVTDPKGHTINLGRKSRLFTGAARDAVLLNDDRCSNCGARHNGVQIDHLLAWEHLGNTDQANAGPNCGWCNREKHRRKITVSRDETGWHYHRPDGTEIAPRWRPKPNTP